MKKIIKKYRGWVFLVAMFVFSLHINAVFEGNTKPDDLPGVRTNVEVTPIGNQSQKATGWDDEPTEVEITEPITDSPLFILLLGGLAYGSYMLLGRRNPKRT